MLLNLNNYLTYNPLTRSKRIVYNEPFEIRYVGRGEEKRYDELTFYFKGLKRTIYLVKLKPYELKYLITGWPAELDEAKACSVRGIRNE